MTVKELTMENYESEVEKSKLPVIIDFYADWCGPCQMMKPIFSRMSENFKGKLNFLKLDTQNEEGLSYKFDISGIPCFVLVDKGKEIGRIVGYMGEEIFKQKIENILKK